MITIIFIYDLECISLGTARIENLINVSSSRIKEPFFIKNKIATITKKDNDAIIKIIKKYYAFQETNIKSNIMSKSIYKNNYKEKYEKILT